MRDPMVTLRIICRYGSCLCVFSSWDAEFYRCLRMQVVNGVGYSLTYLDWLEPSVMG